MRVKSAELFGGLCQFFERAFADDRRILDFVNTIAMLHSRQAMRHNQNRLEPLQSY